MSSRSSRTDLPETVLVGRVLRPHGVSGEVVVQVLSDVPGRFDPGSSLLVADEEGRPGAPAGLPRLPPRLEVETSRPHKGGALVRFAGLADRDGAESLRGVHLAVERARVPPAPEGTYYHYELVGCRCFEGERELGTVVEVTEDGGGLLLIVEREGRRLPVPFVARFLKGVDVAVGEIRLELPPGLVETCAST
jgi:16S rRNA processing protein RimM